MALANPYERAKRRSVYNSLALALNGYDSLHPPGTPTTGHLAPTSPNPYHTSPNPYHTSPNPYHNALSFNSPLTMHLARPSILKDPILDFETTPGAPRIIVNADPVIPNYPVLPLLRKHADYNMKIVVVGDGGCGKTCLLVLYAQQEFPEVYVPTVFENYVTNVETPNHKVIELALWDTAGQEEYDRLRPLSYPNVDVLLVCFSLELFVSLQNVKDTWFPEVLHFCPGIPIVLVGTKADLQLPIPPEYPIQVATDINAIGYVQCLAKQMFNIKTVFNFALNHFQKQVELQEQVERSQQRALKRISRLVGGLGSLMGLLGIPAQHLRLHLRQPLGATGRLRRRGTLYESAVLLDMPLEEDNTQTNPYGRFANDADAPSPAIVKKPPKPAYLEDEFAFTREKQKKKKKTSKRCIIL